MSESDNKKLSTFLTEASNLDGGEAGAKSKVGSAHSNFTVNDGEDGESLNDDDEEEDEEDDDEDDQSDEEYLNDTDEYTNPFSMHLPIKQTTEQEEKELNEANKDENRPLSALAPKIYEQDELHVEISSTPAFQCLEELFQSGKLTGTQVAQLKSKYIELLTTLKKSRENEAQLLKESKECLKKLDENKEILQKADAFPDNLTNEVLKIRAQYLKYENDAACSEERLYDLEYKLHGLEEDKLILEREYARMPKPNELERQIKELKVQNLDLYREIQMRQEEIADLKQSVKDKNAHIDLKKKNYKELLDQIENLKADYVEVNTLPNQISKEFDKVFMEKDEVSKHIACIESELKEASQQAAEMEELRQLIEDKKSEVASQITLEKETTFDKEKEFNDLTKQHELEKEKEIVLQADKATLELSLKHVLAEKKLEYEALNRAQKDKEKEAKNLKRAELQLKACQDSFYNIKLQHEKLLNQKAAAPPADGSLLEKRKELTREVEQAKRELTKEHSETNIQKVRVETRIEVEEHLLCEQSDCRIQAVEVTRLAAIKADEKEQKAREFMKAETRYKRTIEEMRAKDSIIEEHAKRLRELNFKLKDFAKMYDIIKNERNKIVNQIQICTQRAAEMREKLKILNNEHDILRTATQQKEKQLQKQRLKFANIVSLRDSIRTEVVKQRNVISDMSEIQAQQKMNIDNYNTIITAGEQESTRLRRRYEECVKERNTRGVELISRSEEVCVILERVNAQESVLKHGHLELLAREEEIRFLKVRTDEESRQLLLSKKTAPVEGEKRAELEKLRVQLIDCQKNLTKLEQRVEDCHNPERVRMLEGHEDSVDDLIAKMEQIETKLTRVEEQCLEKDLILEQVNRLTDRITNKVDASKEDTLSLAKKINKIQGQIKNTTKKMMAHVSELSIAQASALSLQEEVKTKEMLLERCYNRMEKGEAPNDDWEYEWLRSTEDGERQRNKINKPMPDDKVAYTMPDGYVTTAEPRPNAYIPSENELPLPKPYGRLAPFKPQEPGSSMRHIRKPNPKPIEI